MSKNTKDLYEGFFTFIKIWLFFDSKTLPSLSRKYLIVTPSLQLHTSESQLYNGIPDNTKNSSVIYLIEGIRGAIFLGWKFHKSSDFWMLKNTGNFSFWLPSSFDIENQMGLKTIEAGWKLSQKATPDYYFRQ